jgi:hypothetical protein
MFVYTRNPKLLDEVYNEVLVKLNVMLDENSKEEPARPTEQLEEPQQNPS